MLFTARALLTAAALQPVITPYSHMESQKNTFSCKTNGYYSYFYTLKNCIL